MKRVFVTISILLSVMTAFSQQIYNIKTSDTEDGSIKSEANYKNGELKGKVKEYKKGEKVVE